MSHGREDPFEEKLKRLEEIVERLEREGLPLQEALALFEEGVALVGLCQKELEEVEQRVKILTEKMDLEPWRGA